MSEDCFENSSGLLLVTGAPTIARMKGKGCQQSTFHHSELPVSTQFQVLPSSPSAVIILASLDIAETRGPDAHGYS